MLEEQKRKIEFPVQWQNADIGRNTSGGSGDLLVCFDTQTRQLVAKRIRDPGNLAQTMELGEVGGLNSISAAANAIVFTAWDYAAATKGIDLNVQAAERVFNGCYTKNLTRFDILESFRDEWSACKEPRDRCCMAVVACREMLAKVPATSATSLRL